MNKNLILLIFISVVLSNCQKGPKSIVQLPNDPASHPSQFTVTVADREDSYAIIHWTKSTSSDSSKIAYDVKINGNTVASNLTDTTYKILNLNDSTQYPGQVIAKTTRGLTTTDTFTVHKNLGNIYASDGYNFASYNLGGDKKWSFSAGLLTYPALSHDTVFIQCTSGSASNIYALNAKTGAKYWSGAPTTETGTGLVYSNGVIYTAYSKSNKIVAYSASTGKQLWQFNDGGGNDPTISQGVLFCKGGDGLGSKLYALDAKTGSQLWTHSFVSFAALPTAANGIVFIESSSTDQTSNAIGKFNAFDAKTGAGKWSFSFTGEVSATQSRPVIVGNSVYFMAYTNDYNVSNTVYAIGILSGHKLWSTRAFGGAIYNNITGDSEGIYATTYSFTNKYDPASGTKLYTINYPESDYAPASDIILTPGKLYNHYPNTNTGMYQVPHKTIDTYNIATGTVISSPLQQLSTVGGMIVVIDGKAYYSFLSGMFSTN
ncbi:MAG TPA: PQQ-binding-like beta-propeller repeat protein [Mucilaginibacter sp.]|nr:PQQ-binding-like beta-propeller repeat protein [Mucilaginibacter sp.]